MLSEREEKFLVFWEANRLKRKKGIYQLVVGLPIGLLISALLLANYYSGWYVRADMEANAWFNPVILYVAAGIIAVFIAVFSKKFQWEQHEQHYKELIFKKKKALSPTDAAH